MNRTFIPTRKEMPETRNLLDSCYNGAFEYNPQTRRFFFIPAEKGLPQVTVVSGQDDSLEMVRVAGLRGEGVERITSALYHDGFKEVKNGDQKYGRS